MITPLIAKEFSKAIIPLIGGAKNSICVIAYDWRWYGDDPGNSVQLFNQSLIRKARAGVTVRAVLNEGNIVPILRQNGIDAKRKRFSKFLHSKMILIDDSITILGSHNLTLSAFEFNNECSVVIEDEKINKRFKDFFEGLWL